jgi:flagellar biosynthesis protein FlhG
MRDVAKEKKLNPHAARLPDGQGRAGTAIWAVGGGKGGTGKTLLAANLGIFLARQGRQVILVDADLGCANLHTCLGMPYPQATLSDLLKGRIRSVGEAVTETGIENLGLISGAQDILDIANPKHSQKMRIIRQIQELSVDYIILDLGAGTSFNILDFFLIADLGILAVLPEPTSIENVYRFIKSAFYRKFKKIAKEPQFRELIAEAMDQKSERGIKTPHDLVEEINRLDGTIGRELKQQMYGFKPKLVVNQIRSRDDITLGFSMRSSCSRYFGITVEYPGYIEFDDAAWQAGKKKRPLILEYPYSRFAKGIEKVGENLLERRQLDLDPFLDGIVPQAAKYGHNLL